MQYFSTKVFPVSLTTLQESIYLSLRSKTLEQHPQHHLGTCMFSDSSQTYWIRNSGETQQSVFWQILQAVLTYAKVLRTTVLADASGRRKNDGGWHSQHFVLFLFPFQLPSAFVFSSSLHHVPTTSYHVLLCSSGLFSFS